MSQKPSMDHSLLALFERNGLLRTSHVIHAGFHRRVLYRLRDAGLIEEVSRGLFRLGSLPELSQPDMVIVASRVPAAVLCTISALAWHGITTEIPHAVHVALPRGASRPKLGHPPLSLYWLDPSVHAQDVEVGAVDGVHVRVYGHVRTVVDCFRFRSRLGKDVAIDALKLCVARKGTSAREFLDVARRLHLQNVMMPYLEALA
jgi:predicted transcriptional regulator of viral defense system